MSTSIAVGSDTNASEWISQLELAHMDSHQDTVVALELRLIQAVVPLETSGRHWHSVPNDTWFPGARFDTRW